MSHHHPLEHPYIFASTILKNSKIKNMLKINHVTIVFSKQNEHIFIYNFIYKRMLHSNHLSLYFQVFTLQILFKNSCSNTRGIT
jgi:hypothetical protein